MFNIGDYIMYGKSGVCSITDICKSPFDEKDTRTYYVLKPLHGPSSTIYAPVDNAKVALRSLIEKSDADALINKIPSIEPLKIENEKTRRDIYKETVSSLYPEGYVKIIKTVYGRRKAFEAARRHITEVDSEYESLSKRSLYSELSVVLEIPYENVEGYIFDRIEKMNVSAES